MGAIPARRCQDDLHDAVWLAAIARGDRAAFAAFYHRHAATVLGLLVRILRDPIEAEDVLQEVFLQVWQRAPEFDSGRSAPFVWLSMLARSRALDRLDALASRERLTARAALDVTEPAADTADVAVSREANGRLHWALGGIPPMQRKVLLLAYFEGLTQSDIATRLGVPLGTVKSMARLGLLKLRRRLEAAERWWP